MKKLAALPLVLALIGGCSTQPVTWQQDNQIEISDATVVLKSNLWINKMPTIGAVQDSTLHGALYLESDKPLPAELDVESVTIQQGEQNWIIEGDLLEMRTHNQNQWEVVFVWQIPVDIEQPVDIALQIKGDDNLDWLVEKNIKVDTVY